MNWIDSAIASVFPGWGLKRLQARTLMRAYEAAQPSRLWKDKREAGTADQAVAVAGRTLVEKARYLEENYDLARGVLTTMVDHIVGADGIQVEPQPKTVDGEIHEGLARQLQMLYEDLCLRPEVTWRHKMASAQRMMCRSWIRDGESLAQRHIGNIPSLDHGTRLPYSIEMIEADYLPMDYNDETRGIVQGVEKSGWGRPRAYHLLKRTPGTLYTMPASYGQDTRRIPADRMIHLAALDRMHQTRGVSMFASVLTRFGDIKDYDESERVAARIAAAMALQVIKGDAASYLSPKGQTPRSFPIEPGMVFDQLLPGERIETIQSNRPSPMAEPFRNSMMRAIAAGVNTSYSSSSKNYGGTYSSQRQELVEQDLHYRVLRNEIVYQVVFPVYRDVAALAVALGMVPLPENLDPLTLYDAAYQGPAMVWIDPDKEAKGMERRVLMGERSLAQVIRAAGGNPREVYAQIKRERAQHEADGLIFSSNAAYALKLKEAANEESAPSED